MNVFAFELRRQLRSLLTDSVVMAVLVTGLLAACFPVYRDAKADVEQILAGYPPQFLATFGLTDKNGIFSFAGFFRFSYLYLALAAAIMASAWGLSVFGRESRSRCDDFLLAMPASRWRVFAGKLGACLACVAVLTAVTVASCLWSQAYAGADEVEAGRVALAALELTGVELVALAAGALLGSCLRRVRSVSGLATGIGLAGWILYILPDLLDEKKLRWLSPFSWFDPERVFNKGAFTGKYLVAAAVVVLVLLAAAAVRSILREARAA